MVDDADDAAAVADAGFFFGLLDMQQHAVAESGGGAGARLARKLDADFGRGAVRLGVPFIGRGDEIAVGVARGDIGEHGLRQHARVMQLLAALFDCALVGELAQQALQVGAQIVLQVEGAGDLAGADLAGALPDEGEKIGFGGEGGGLFGGFSQMSFPAPMGRLS